MKKAQRKDFLREIGKSRNRFISILLITALGVAFYAGIRSAKPDMRLTADTLYDETGLMDIRIVSTMGLTEEDLQEVSRIPGVLKAETGMETEAFATLEDKDRVLQIFSMGDEINRMEVTEGRLPQKSGECLADNLLRVECGVKAGDQIRLFSGTVDEDGGKTDILDTLNQDTYTVVGFGDYSKYLSWDRGSAKIGNGTADGFLVIPQEDFYQDPEAVQTPIYHNIYVSVEGAKELQSYSDEYEDLVEGVVDAIKGIADTRCEIRYTAVKADADRQIADAKQEIADGEKEIVDGEKEIADGEKEIADGEKEIADGEQEIADAEKELADAEEKLADGEQTLADSRKKLDDGWAEYRDGLAEYEKNRKSVGDAREELLTAKEELDKKQDEVEKGWQEIENGLAALAAAREELDGKKDELAAAEEQFFTGFAAMGMTNREQILSYVAGNPELSAQYQTIQAGKEQISLGEKELAAKEEQAAESEETLKAGEEALKEAGKEWQDGWNQMHEGELELAKAKKTLDDAEAELVDGEREYADGKQELIEARAEYEEKKSEADTELADARADIEDAKSEIADAKKEMADAKLEIEDAKKDVEEGKLEVADAEADLADLKKPEWIVLQRSNSLQNYVEFGQDAERIGAIGEVFPALFFLVAALVCLTTMTRMVEEERTQIGTMKALGYSKTAVASKYVLYALSACLAGGVLGVSVGNYLFPYVIIKAYQILYYNLPEPLLPVQWDYAVMSIVIAVFCTVLATALACYKELADVPAELMRPASPKQGKRVLLERVGFIWRHMNFTWKSTVRNLFRYKKRLFMTIFGIGGSMSLLMVGFGIRDSIQAIVDNQYQTIWTYDAFLSIDEDLAEEEKVRFEQEMNEREEAVTETLGVRSVAMDVRSGDVTKNVNVFVPQTMEEVDDFLVLRNRINHERYHMEDGGAVVSEKLAKLLSLEVGDTMYLMESETEKYPVKITAIAENYLNHYVYLTPATYEQVLGKAPVMNQLFLKLSDMEEPEQEALAKRLLSEDMVKSLMYVSELQEKVANMMRSLDLVIWVLIASAGLLAFVVLYNLNNISIMERRRELATLKVLGFYDIEVAEYVYRENVFLTGFGIVAGIILGLLLHRFVIQTCEIDMLMFGRAVRPLSYLGSILLTALFAGIVNFSMFYKLRKIDMVESLKSVE